MGKVVEKRKKKGRPSLLDLQKRKIKEQNETQQQQHANSALKPSHNYNPATPTPFRRSTRRNPAPDASLPEDTTGGDEELSSRRHRREKTLKHVLKLPNSSSGNQGGSDSDREEDDDAAHNPKKRKIAAIGGGSGAAESEKGENPRETAEAVQGIQLDSGASTPLPDKKLLLFILDRIQKKDTYGVFSEPVDPEELPDYHDIIEHPVDFGTVRKKLEGGVYANLEQFEKDVFLISSNAMQYNSPDTVYFRQARAIHELAKKNFQDLRQDGNDYDGPAPEPKRRGRPPTKNLKKPPGRPPLDRAASASSDATLATGGENKAAANYDPRKGQFYAGLVNSVGRPRINDIYASWVSQNRYERNDEFPGSSSKGSPMKYGKKQGVPDEDRRSTYMQFHSAMSAHEPSVLATFSRERKQLMAVGLHSDHGYARSLARFAATLGPGAWEIASKRIQRSLPGGVEYGRGWVGENDVVPQRWPPEKAEEVSEVQATKANRDSLCSNGKVEEEEGAVDGSSSNGGLTSTVPRSQVHPSLIHHGSNGFNSSFTFNTIAAHMGKLIGAGGTSLHPNHSSGPADANKEDSDPLPQKPKSLVPPDLNVRFNSASPSSAQPDLALQL